MSVSIKYKGAEIASASTDTTKTIKTSGKYCEGDIEVINTQDGGITPSGSIEITENDTYDVTEYAEAVVNVPQGITPSGKKLITDTSETDVAAFATAQVSSDTLLAENVKKDVNILGVVGSFEGGGGAERSVWYRPPDYPDFSNVSEPSGSYSRGVYQTVNTMHPQYPDTLSVTIPSNRYFSYGYIDDNGNYVSEYSISTAGTFEIPAPTAKKFIVFHYTDVTFSNYIPVVETVVFHDGAWPWDIWQSKQYASSEIMTMKGKWGNMAQSTILARNAVYFDLSGLNAKAGQHFDSLRKLFNYCTNLGEVVFPAYFQTINFTDMRDMFSYCYSIPRVDLRKIKTSSVETVANIFSNCYNLTEINISGNDFGAVTSATDAFYNCDKLTDIITDSTTVLPPVNFGLAQSSMLTDASLVNIANALVAGAHTITLHATPKGRLSTIMGTVADEVFTADESGTMTLENFITQTKGWTVA